ncbi:TetR/AcrR family transcriptional regulator [Magnetococcus sp. PR-3]|uniref:TetR/AcrR family transcriptional regulator n=1 Tax=Magnetococcus sp. PR-3 TaxID=3120355 RepID=UPI002FCE324C
MNDKKRLILDAAITLFARDGFWNTSTSSISKKAGVGTGTLFNHFSSKDALINAVYVALKKELHASIMATWQPEGELREKLLSAWHGVIQWALRNPVHFDLMEQLRVSEMVSQETREAMTAEFSAFQMDMRLGVTEKVLVDLPVGYHLLAGWFQISAVITYLRSSEGHDQDVCSLIDNAFSAYWNGVAVG